MLFQIGGTYYDPFGRLEGMGAISEMVVASNYASSVTPCLEDSEKYSQITIADAI